MNFNILVKIILYFTLASITLFANTANKDNNDEVQYKTDYASYMHMSTSELEKEVEAISQKGEVPFEMGLELIRRWQTKA